MYIRNKNKQYLRVFLFSSKVKSVVITSLRICDVAMENVFHVAPTENVPGEHKLTAVIVIGRVRAEAAPRGGPDVEAICSTATKR